MDIGGLPVLVVSNEMIVCMYCCNVGMITALHHPLNTGHIPDQGLAVQPGATVMMMLLTTLAITCISLACLPV